MNLNLVQFVEELQSQCDLCEKRFRRKENMDVHKRLVHKEGVIEVSEGQRCMFCKRHQKQCSLKEKQIEKCTDGGKDDQCS